MSLAALIGIDKERYDAGNKFLSQDPYLQNFQGRAPITFNTSAPNVDMMYGGNTNIYGAPTGGDGGITTVDTPFNQIENLFPTPSVPYENELSFQGKVPGMDIPAINFKDAPVDFMLRENNPRVLDPLVNAKNAIQGFDISKLRDYGMKGLASKLFSEGGARAGFGIAGFPGALAGMIGGGILGFGARGPTDEERIIANFYGNQGNQPGFYIDPETGKLEESLMQGYNISSAYGKGIPAAIQKRIATIRNRKAKQTEESLQRIKDLEKEAAALEASRLQQAQNMQDRNRATGTGGYQAGYSGDFMEGPSGRDAFSGDTDLSGTMGSS